jgi:hypothetical protein
VLSELEQKIPPDFFTPSRTFNPFNHWERPRDAVSALQQHVEEAVGVIVDSTHTGFHVSTAGFGSMLQAFTESQRLVEGCARVMTESKRVLSGRNSDLKDLWFQNAMYAVVLRVLAKAGTARVVVLGLVWFG